MSGSFGKWIMHIGLICYGYLIILDPNSKEAFPTNLSKISQLHPTLACIQALVPFAFYIQIALGGSVVLSIFSLASNSKIFCYIGLFGLALFSLINNNPLLTPNASEANFEVWLRLLKIISIAGGLVYRLGEAAETEEREKEKNE